MIKSESTILARRKIPPPASYDSVIRLNIILTVQPDIANLDWHLLPVDDIFERLSTSPTQGLSTEQVARKLKEVGRNVLTPPPSRWFRKTISYLFGGFGSILFTAAILVFVAWKPLGQPPAVANLALAIVLVLVWVIQASFAFYQGKYLLN